MLSMDRVFSQPVSARLLPRQPVFLALGEVVEVPGDEANDAESSHDEE